MIKSRTEPLPNAEFEALQKWLSSPNFDTLLKVIESQENQHLVAVCGDLMKARDGAGKIDTANAKLVNVHAHATCREILEGIAKLKVPPEIVKFL